MSFYKQIIMNATGCADADVSKIENLMREVIFGEELDGKTPAELRAAALRAWRHIQFCRTPEGIAKMKEAEDKFYAGK